MAGKITDLSQVTIDRSADLLEIVDVSANASKNTTVNAALGITGNPVGDADVQTVTNKTLTTPTINGATLSGTLSGTYTIGGTPTFPASVVLLTGTQSITGAKTFTNATLTAPTITNANLTADAITGFSSANTGTIYGMAVTSGALGTSALATNAVQGNQLATTAITVGYAQITANFTTASTSAVQITGLTTTVTIPAGGRHAKISVYTAQLFNSSATTTTIGIWAGAVGVGTLLQTAALNTTGDSTSTTIPIYCVIVNIPSAGSITYNASLTVGAGTTTFFAATTSPAFILVEVI